MGRKFKFLIVTVFVCFLLTTASFAATITDLDTFDTTTIDNHLVEFVELVPGIPALLNIVDETYSFTHTVPYPSHNGFAIIDTDGTWFEKEITPVVPLEIFEFNVYNNTPYVWSEYHFLFNDTQGVIFDILYISSNIFTNWDWDGTELKFWEPVGVAPGDTVQMSFTLLADKFLPIGVTQIATTVPEPTTLLLFGIGLLGLARVSRRKM